MSPFASPTSQTLLRVGAAQSWHKSTREHALLAVQGDDGLTIVALGTVEGGSRATHRGTRDLQIRVRYLLSEVIPLNALVQTLSSSQRRLLTSMLNGPLRPLSPKLGSAVLSAIRSAAPGIEEILSEIREQLNAELIDQAQTRVRRPAVLVQEAVSSALRFFRRNPDQLTPEPAPNPSPFALLLEESAGVVENDVIADDSVAFPGWERSDFSHRGWWEFHDAERRLLIKNINVSPQETRTGADLVYVRRDPDTFVLVQYKLMSALADGRLVYRPDGRLDSQVERMIELENTPRGTVEADDAGTYRVGPGFSFVKFVEPAAARADKLGALTPGLYLPSEYARRLLLVPEAGPQGGVVHFVANHRSIPSDTFTRLVRDAWVGSTGDATVLLREIFGLRDSTADLIMAVDEPLEPKDPNVVQASIQD